MMISTVSDQRRWLCTFLFSALGTGGSALMIGRARRLVVVGPGAVVVVVVDVGGWTAGGRRG